MSKIIITDGQEGNILDFITAKNIISDNHKKSLEDTLETYNFITFADKRYSEHLEKRNRVIIPDEDGSLIEFVTFEVAKYKDTEGYKVQSFTHASYLELKKAAVLYPDSFKGTASQHAGRTLDSTGWQVGIVEVSGNKTLSRDNHTNPYEFLKHIAKEFNAELRFRIERDGNKITGRYVDLLERVGEWRGRVVEFGKDLDNIRRVEKQDIVTALLGLGPEREDGTRMEVLVEDFDALKRWGRVDEHGELQHLIEPYEIQSDRDEMTTEEARQYTRTALDKRINTQVSYEAGIIDLENVPGMENKKIRFGDSIRIKDTNFNPALFLEARIFEQNRSIKKQSKKDVKLGDYIEYTEEEVNAIWKRLEKEVRKRVSHYEMAEYTYDKLTIDDKDEQIYEDGKTFAEATGVEAEENAKEFAVEQDKKIKVDVEEYADTVAEQKADSAYDKAKQYAVAKEVYENQMDKIADDIEDRAPLEYVDGEFKIIKDDIDKFDAEIEKKADGSTVYTIEDVDNMINNTVSVTEYETDKEGIVKDIKSHGTRIGQNEEAIGLKADSSELDAVENSLNTKIGNVEVTADGAKMTASEVRADLDGLEIGGRNLILDSENTRKSFNQDYHEAKVKVSEVDMSSEWKFKKAQEYSITGGTSRHKVINKVDGANGMELDTYYTVSFYAKNTGDKEMRFHLQGATKIKTPTDIHLKPNSSKKVVFTFQRREDYDWSQIMIQPAGAVSDSVKVIVGRIKMEKGNKATDWTPAPEDIDGHIDEVGGRVETLDASVETLAGEVSLKASQSVVDSLEGRVETAEGELEILPGEINAKVSKDGAFGELNLSPDKALLDFERVNIKGKLEAEHIKSLAGLNINDQFVVDDSGKVTIGNDGVTIDDKSISIKRPDGATSMEDGLVRQDYSVTSFDPYDMDYVSLNGSLIDGVFQASRGFYRAGAGAIIGDSDYDDIRDPDKGYTVKFTVYEFIHTARYLVIGYRKGVNIYNPRHKVHVYEGSDLLYNEWHEAGGSPSYAPITLDLGKPTYERIRYELRIGVNRSDVSSDNTVIFRINRVYQTDFLD